MCLLVYVLLRSLFPQRYVFLGLCSPRSLSHQGLYFPKKSNPGLYAPPFPLPSPSTPSPKSIFPPCFTFPKADVPLSQVNQSLWPDRCERSSEPNCVTKSQIEVGGQVTKLGHSDQMKVKGQVTKIGSWWSGQGLISNDPNWVRVIQTEDNNQSIRIESWWSGSETKIKWHRWDHCYLDRLKHQVTQTNGLHS